MTPHRPALAGVLLAIVAALFAAPTLVSAAPVESEDATVTAASELHPIVAVALQYEGTVQGQCWTFVQNVVKEATGRQIGFDYREGFFEAGAIEVSVEDAGPGDIIQIADDSYTAPDASYAGLHTSIIMENLGDGTFNVIDSNSQWDEVVRLRPNYRPADAAARYGINFHIYRISDEGEPFARVPAPAPAAPEPTTVAPEDSATVNTPGECLNLRDSAGLGGAIITCLSHGTSVTVLSEPQVIGGREWVEVSTAAGTGWVAAEYLNEVEPAPTSSAGNGATRPPFLYRIFVGAIATDE